MRRSVENWKKCPLCNGPRKTVSLQSKVKFARNMQKPLDKLINLVLSIKQLERTVNIKNLKRLWKLTKKAKAINFAKSTVWVKN